MDHDVLHDHVVHGGENPRRMADLGLAEYAIDRFALAGTPRDWIARIEQLAERGATRLWVGVSGDADSMITCRTKMKLTWLGTLIWTWVVACALVGGCTSAPPHGPGAGGRSAPRPDVVWVPSSPAVIKAMLEIAHVGAGDVVYDLGCGEGEIVIAAALLGARGVGVDIDPARIANARRNAAQAGVTDRVTFIEQDLFETDVSAATVVTLYLGPDLNRRLRPKLLRELRPGTRVVSHDFSMGEWAPERAVTVPQAPGHQVLLWRVPAR
ncbi:MAG TPA: methyltransferase domain-containing protein [Methylomirabilota bacterium]